MDRFALLLVASFLLVRCGGAGEPVNTLPDLGGADAAGDETSGVDGGVDLASPGDVGTDLGLDLQPVDLVTEVDLAGPACAPGEGCFLDPCAENGDCQSGWCVSHMGDSVCTQACQEECPPGWSCKQVGGTDPDLVFVCVSHHAHLCKPCSDNGDCEGIGTAASCLDYGDEGSFCGGTCASDEDCPWGFLCSDVVTVDGIGTLQCVAEAGVCPCTPTSVARGLFTPCEVTNEFGTCLGKRVCTEEGLSDCDAPEPLQEVCNGVDDDCDGDIDEPAFVEGSYHDLCDDGNECTMDSCLGEGGCEHEALSEGECKDGDSCTIGDHCEAGLCVGSPIDCDDDNPCTDDTCDGLGGCKFEFNQADCDDGDPCTVADECNEGLCAGVAIACDCLVDADCTALEDGDVCNGTLVCDTGTLPHQCIVDPETPIVCPEPEGPQASCLAAFCDPQSGACSVVPANDGFSCDDGDACTVGDQCGEGACQPGVPVVCSDGNVCTDDDCDSELGCQFVDNDASCSDGDACTVADFCAAGSCQSGAVLQCDDGNPCTSDSCDPNAGCVHEAIEGFCDDGNACTLNDQCNAGKCAGTSTLNCDDEDVCTTDSCDPVQGCLHLLNSAPCDDGDICTTGDHCHLGECISAGALSCSDLNPCTDDSCNPASGCVFAPNAALCDDGNACTEQDHCEAGQCKPGGTADCDDGNLCTDDYCDFEAGCLHVSNTVPCDDGDLCTANEACLQGECVGGVPIVCNDDNPCTDDACASEVGCFYTNNVAACDDGLACTAGDTCANGECIAGGATDCDDGNPCTTDTCSEPDGCGHAALPDGTECGENLECVGGQCTNACQPGSQTFNYTGSVQTFELPACATAVVIEAWGAAGGYYENVAYAGKGGYVKATATGLANQTLYVYVGGKGSYSGSHAVAGWNGGGGHSGGNSYTVGGGGASDVRVGGQSYGNRVLVAGGGGGSAWCYNSTAVGGHGGGTTGGNGGHSGNSPEGYGRGGTPSAGGDGGYFSGYAPDGSLGVGGNALNTNSGCGGAGGGGGGLYGGGGGAHGGGGGGGSSYVNPAYSNITHQQGTRSGNGQITISW